MSTPVTPKTLKLLAEKSDLFVQNAELALHNLIESHDTYLGFIKDRPEAKDNLFLSFLDTMIEFRMGLVIGVAELSSNIRNLVQSDLSYLKRYYILQINARLSDCYKFFLGIGKDKRGVWKQFKKPITKYKNGSFLSQYNKLTVSYRDFKNIINKYERDVVEHYSSPDFMYIIYSNANSEEAVSKRVILFLSIIQKMYKFAEEVLNDMIEFFKLPPMNSPSSNDLTVPSSHAILSSSLRNGKLPQALNHTMAISPNYLDQYHQVQLRCRKIMESLKKYEDNIIRDSLIMTWSAMTDLMMFLQFVRADLACAMHTYLKSQSELEFALCLRRIHIIKTSALTRLYGYNHEERNESLWRYATIVLSSNRQLKNEQSQIEKKFQIATSSKESDNDLRTLYVHYRDNSANKIPELVHVISKLIPMSEFDKALSFLGLCNDIEAFITRVISIGNGHLDQKSKRFDMNSADLEDLIKDKSKEDKTQWQSMINDIRRVFDGIDLDDN